MSSWIRSCVFIALFSALFIVSSFIKVPLGFTPIPLSLQTFIIMLSGGLLGATYGFWSIFLVVFLTTLGLPLMNGLGGMAQLLGPTGGFIFMFPVSAWLIGLFTDLMFKKGEELNFIRHFRLFIGIFILGALLVYASGILWMAHLLSEINVRTLIGALQAGVYPYLIGDFLKAFVATEAIVHLRPVLPQIRPTKTKNPYL